MMVILPDDFLVTQKHHQRLQVSKIVLCYYLCCEYSNILQILQIICNAIKYNLTGIFFLFISNSQSVYLHKFYTIRELFDI